MVNYWLARLQKPGDLLSGLTAAEAAYVFEYPYGRDRRRETQFDPHERNMDVARRDLIVAIRRMIVMRPLPEDHPQFTGSNPDFHSILAGWSNPNPFLIEWGDGVPIDPEVVSVTQTPRWDVDNDGDGIFDSVWLDFGFPTIRAKDGRVYRPLIAPLCVDLDSRVNLNTADRLARLAPVGSVGTTLPNWLPKWIVAPNGMDIAVPGAVLTCRLWNSRRDVIEAAAMVRQRLVSILSFHRSDVATIQADPPKRCHGHRVHI